jgi:hypothetical protein
VNLLISVMKFGMYLVLLILLLALVPRADSVIKQNYGGNIKVAEDLLERVNSYELFRSEKNTLRPLYPLPFKLEGSTATLDLTSLNPDQRSEIEKSVLSLGDTSNPCHWILDYPNLGHEHATSISIEENHFVVSSSEPDLLPFLLNSSCLVPDKLSFLIPFKQTQFGFEANPSCLAGRPFLDSISSVVVDSANPYLSFKLNDVDVFSLPEDRFQQVANDPEIRIQDGPRYYLYFKTSNLTAEEVFHLTGFIHLKEAAAAVLNDHLEILLGSIQGTEADVSAQKHVSFFYPSEYPYRIIGERLSLQFKEAGIPVDSKHVPGNTPTIELEYIPIQDSDFDAFRYHLLLNEFKTRSTQPWYEEWDQLESSGAIVPLLIHTSRIAIRKNIQDIRTRQDGFPDFANCWILQKP